MTSDAGRARERPARAGRRCRRRPRASARARRGVSRRRGRGRRVSSEGEWPRGAGRLRNPRSDGQDVGAPGGAYRRLAARKPSGGRGRGAKRKIPAATGQFAAGLEDCLGPLSPLSHSESSLGLSLSRSALSLASLSMLQTRKGVFCKTQGFAGRRQWELPVRQGQCTGSRGYVKSDCGFSGKNAQKSHSRSNWREFGEGWGDRSPIVEGSCPLKRGGARGLSRSTAGVQSDFSTRRKDRAAGHGGVRWTADGRVLAAGSGLRGPTSRSGENPANVNGRNRARTCDLSYVTAAL